MQIPILNGIYTDNNSDFRTSYPRNLQPVVADQTLSQGYLRQAEGIIEHTTGPGIDKGGINWNGVHYRVMGTKLVSIDSAGVVTELGTAADGTYARFNYSFDRLSVNIGGNLYYWTGTTFLQVTDPDLGAVIDHIWIDGYFMTTDGVNLVITELSDPLSVNPFKYGSSEVDPDPIKATLKVRDEAYALNRHTIEVFDNVGAENFPFQRIETALITKGAIGTRTCCVISDLIAFMGGGRGEAISVYLASNGSAGKIATREIDLILKEYTETQLENSLMEARLYDNHALVYIHLPDKALVYDLNASRELNVPVWFVLDSGGQYLARNFVYVYNKWYVGNPATAQIGETTKDLYSHWGDKTTWDFVTTIIYNNNTGAVFHDIELIALTGRTNLSDDPLIYTQFTNDGLTYSQPQFINSGKIGETTKRLSWPRQGMMRQIRMQKFSGDSDCKLSMVRLEANIEPLYV